MRYAVLGIMLFTSLAVADVYKSVTSDGEVIFSDQPSPGAERVRLPELTTYKPKPVGTTVSARPADVAAAPTETYKSFNVTAPEDQATFWDNEGVIAMRVSIEPALQVGNGHRIQYYLDGKPYGTPEQSLGCTFRNLLRGSHILSAEVLNQSGIPVMKTDQITVHLHKASIQHPNNPLNQKSAN